MYLRLSLLALAATALCACGSKKADAAATPAVPGAEIRLEPPNRSAPAVVPIAAVITATDSSALLAQLTQSLRRFSAEQRRVPATLDEVVVAGYLKALPPAPAGKHFVINPKQVEVILE